MPPPYRSRHRYLHKGRRTRRSVLPGWRRRPVGSPSTTPPHYYKPKKLLSFLHSLPACLIFSLSRCLCLSVCLSMSLLLTASLSFCASVFLYDGVSHHLLTVYSSVFAPAISLWSHRLFLSLTLSLSLSLVLSPHFFFYSSSSCLSPPLCVSLPLLL